MVKKQKHHHIIILTLIIVIASFFRLYGLNWDQNQHLHPDERFLTMVTNDITWPSSLFEYLGENNPLSPYNNGYDFFVYGTFTVYLVKFISGFIVIDTFDYNNITLVGRLISAFMDIGVVVLVYKISKLIFDKNTALISSFLYSIFVLPIQLSHFYASDTFLVFFLFCSFYLLLKSLNAKKIWVFAVLSGINYGLALASKISALYFLPLIVSVIFFLILKKGTRNALSGGICFVTASLLTWRMLDIKTFASGYLFKINPKFSANIKQLHSFNDPEGWFPPAVQWIKSTPILFPLKNLSYWGLGLPISLLLLISLLYLIYKNSNYLVVLTKRGGIKTITKIKQPNYFLICIILFILSLFFYQGIQFVKAMRYFYILYPLFSIIIAVLLTEAIKNKKLLAVILMVSLVYPLSFMSIYTHKHTRIQASEWIYKNIPIGSTLTCEHWDDCLPLPIKEKSHTLYQIETLELFHPDSSEKWVKINNQFEDADYIILSSNRLWGPIPSVPERYPLSAQYYNELLNDRTKFKKVTEFTSRPTIPFLKIELIDDHADESFTVYDHPKVMIFKKSF